MLKARIQQLRDQSRQKGNLPRRVSASDASLRQINATLKDRIKRLTTENQELRKQNEVYGASVLKVRELGKQIQRLEAENLRLKQSAPANTAGQSSEIEQRLSNLGVAMNSTLRKLMASKPEGIVETAIQALKEAHVSGSVSNPGGFLNRAISDCWHPNGDGIEQQDELAEFNAWWPEAYSKGLVVASQQSDAGIMVLDARERWISFNEAKSLIRLIR